MKQPVLLCYNLDLESARSIRLATMRLKIRMRNVQPWEQHIPLETLCTQQPLSEREASSGAFADKMLVMGYFPNGAIPTLLQLMRKSGVPSIPLKAALTDTNASWDSVTLHSEIARERKAILQGTTAVHTEG